VPKRQRSETKALPTRRALIDLMGAARYRPLDKRGLKGEFNVPKSRESAFAGLLDGLMADGTIVYLKRKGFVLAKSADLVSGQISIKRSGVAFVRAPESGREFFIPATATGTALNGDVVLIRLNRPMGKRQRSDLEEATVLRVLKRHTRMLVGTLRRKHRFYYVEPMQSWLQHDIIVPDTGGAALGDRVLVELGAWDDPRVSPEGEVTEVIGPADDPALDTLAVIKSHQLPTAFPPDAVAEVEGAGISTADRKGRLDLRRRFVFTVDPESARDYDDAISLERLGGGQWRLGVHIADVSHFVKPDSALDVEALKRGNSVYLPDKVIPMLPEQLSNGLCSLKENVDRLAFSVLMTLDADGIVRSATFHESVIRSRLRLSYEQALAALQTPDGAAFEEAGMDRRAVACLKRVHAIAQKLRANRFRNMALNMEVPEVKFIITEDGRIADVEPVVNDVSHQLIEECMLLTNETVCRELAGRGRSLIHRIHEEPDPEKLAEAEETLLLAGVEAVNLSDRRNLCAVLEAIAGSPEAPVWNTVILKAMKRAAYSHKPVGHFGLGKQYYTHFTSPIRRYADLIVHRLLKASLSKRKPPYENAQLAEIAERCTERGNIATEAEREIVELKKIRFFAEQLESGDLRDYDAVVTEVRNFGVFVYIPEVEAYGLIHVSQLADDFFDFNPARLELRGRRGGDVLAAGRELTVAIARIDADRRRLDFQPVAGFGNAAGRRRKSRIRKGKSVKRKGR